MIKFAQLLELLDQFETDYVQISPTEIGIPVIAINADAEQGEYQPESEYKDNPLIADEMVVHLSVDETGFLNWSIISDIFSEEEE
jgi:hypothetical protein